MQTARIEPADRPSASGAGGGGGRGLAGSGLAALGIVFGDLGTSPLYTLQTVVSDAGGRVDVPTVLGSLSLLVWALILVVTLKYATVVMQADNHGEGGILALLALVGARLDGRWWSRTTLLTAAGLFGAALLYGDGVITPSISVLSALEGVDVITSSLKPFVLPAAVAILVGLYAAQTLGTARIGVVFGPVMLVWFATIGGIGLVNIGLHPAVLRGLDPLLGVAFLVRHGFASFVVLGGVFLAATGAEALYADMSHVGRLPIRASWALVVLPALLLSYAGQAAVLVGQPGQKGNPFFLAVPHVLLVPMVVLATAATIIASQSIITGTFTLTRQAMQLGWFPGLHIRQTSDTEYGQIYVPVVNWVMMAATIGVALGFRSSDALSGAYGTAVATTMLMTTALIYDVMRARWHWPVAAAVPVAGAFLLVDAGFFVANLLKIVQGGYVPLAIGAALLVVMTTWHRGIVLVRAALATLGAGGETIAAGLADGSIHRSAGCAVFLSRSDATIPPLLQRYAADFRTVPERAVVLTVVFEERPRVAADDRVQVRAVAGGLWQVTVRFGFVEIPNLVVALDRAQALGVDVALDRVTYFTADDHIVPGGTGRRMAAWRRMLFGFMYRNAVRPSDRFALPRERLVEIGHQIEI